MTRARERPVKDSIAEFERSLTTPNSRFDRYLRHDTSALTGAEQEGYRLFKSFGCASCHQGVGVGGNMYQKMGVMVPYFPDSDTCHGGGPRPFQRHRRSAGHVYVQGSQPAERGNDPAVFP